MSDFDHINRMIEGLHESTPAPDPLSKAAMAANPYVQFCRWFEAAVRAGQSQANAMCLATADAQRRPAARMVLLKKISEQELVFYTNVESRKGRELAQNPQATLLFYWEAVRRQVRVEGGVARVPDEQARAYYQSRDPGSQLGAWASPQSKAVGDRQQLDRMLAEVEERFAGQAPPYLLPPHWGGYRLKPDEFEFWQHRHNRLHDRFVYRLEDDGAWSIRRLAP